MKKNSESIRRDHSCSNASNADMCMHRFFPAVSAMTHVIANHSRYDVHCASS